MNCIILKTGFQLHIMSTQIQRHKKEKKRTEHIQLIH